VATETLTERQQAWFRSVRDGIERETGRSFDAWVAIARACPEVRPRARLAWFKSEHGLGQNRASIVLASAFPEIARWGQPEALADALWHDPMAKAIFEAVSATAIALGDVTIGQRNGYTAFSRDVQFAAAKPRGCTVLLCLALPPQSDPRLTSVTRPIGSDRLTAMPMLDAPAEVPPIAPLLAAARARS
jgi:hypothetical protein